MEREELIRTLVEIRDPDFLFAQQHLADAGLDLLREPAKARSYLEKMAAQGVHEAQLALAKLLATGTTGEVDRPLAYSWCKLSVEGGYTPALVLLSTFYEMGWGGVERDDARALALLHEAADAGYAHAAALLATAYSEGIRVPADQAKSTAFLMQAAEAGDAFSQFMAGTELLRSKSMEHQKDGVRWILAAASQDLPSAHRELAILYKEGAAGLPRDEGRSRFHRRRAEKLEGPKR